MKTKKKKYRRVIKWNWDLLWDKIIEVSCFPYWIRETSYVEEK